MKPFLFSLLALICLTLCFAQPRGTTQAEFPTGGICVGQAESIILNKSLSAPAWDKDMNRDEWYTIDSIGVNFILRAGQQSGMQYSTYYQSMQLCSSQGTVIPEAQLAIDKSPVWLKADLANVFSQLSTLKQMAWAAIINDASDPYIDEIAFAVAHSSVQYLASNFSDPALFVENAQLLYSIENELPYVQIVNYGSSTTDPDYYSTTQYYKTTADSQVVQMTVPRDIYYWYIVHPKITDEIPAYINPALSESNTTHSNNINPPPDGVFWRNYLYTVQELDYPVLRDTLMLCQTAFNRNGTSGDAIRAIQWWINHTMSFTSGTERPHQPVRIYKKHMGRCGEYADYTAAASRIALIPCTSILSVSTDHTWNEFWEDGWVQWEPVNGYIDAPLVYENGWGKVFGTVFEIRSDGFLTSVTDRYSEGLATITIAVRDSSNHPIDGARVILAFTDPAMRVDMVGFTDNDGNVVFTVGENRHYYARVESSVGIFPTNPGTYLSLMDNAVDGENYAYQMTLTLPKPVPHITTIPVPADDVLDWRFYLDFMVPNQVLYGKVTWDDLAANGSPAFFYKTVNAPGKINLLMTDADNYLFYGIDQTASAFNVTYDQASGAQDFSFPTSQDWYAFLDNSCRVANAQLVTSLMLYSHYGVANDDNVLPSAVLKLYQNYPNPFSSGTFIRYNLPKSAKTDICIYNIKGQKVRTLFSENSKAGLNEVVWDGRDDSGSPVANGVYFCKLTAAGKTLSRKLILLK